MPAFLAALGAVSSVLGIVSFFEPDEADADRQQKFDDLMSKLADLQNADTSQANALIGQSLGSSDTALNSLARYASEDDSATRSDIAQNAIQLADLGLNEIIQQINANISTASVETLTYGYHALSFAMSARIEVAKVVEDGPLGSSGLHARLKSAAELLYNDSAESVDLVGAIESRISSDIAVTEVNQSYLRPIVGPFTLIIGTSAHIGYRVTAQGNLIPEGASSAAVYSSSQSASSNVQRYYLTDGLNHPSLASNAAKNAIPGGLGATLKQRVFNDELEAINIANFREQGMEANAFLAASVAAAASNDISLTSGDNVAGGTSLADYIQGRSGDDALTGFEGPDALSGGNGNDILRGGVDADFLNGGAGSDFLIGGNSRGEATAGDTARFDGLLEEFDIRGGTEYATVTGLDGVRDKVFNVQYLRFDDAVVELGAGSALDGVGNPEDFVTAEFVALLYEAALNREGNIDSPGLNFYVDAAERLFDEDGFTREQVIELIAEDLMNSREFTQNFGDAETLSNGALLDQIYNNVLGRSPDTGGRQFYLELLNAGTISKAEALADIAISPENTAEATQVLMSLHEATTPEVDARTDIALDWYFVA